MRLPRNELLIGDTRDLLPTLPTSSTDLVITSPAFYKLRDYGHPDQMGMESDVAGWVEQLRGVMHELERILKPTASCWINLGDTFSAHQRDGAPPKSLLLAPERLAIALIEDGWTLRSKLVWSKTNAMPSSVKDRLSCTWEIFYLFVRTRSYYFDLDAIRVPHRSRLARPSRAAAQRARTPAQRPSWAGPLAGSNNGLDKLKARGLVGHVLGRNPGDVWALATSNYRGEHHAGFPVELIRRLLRASCPERVCVRCGVPWTRARPRTVEHLAVLGELRARCSCRCGWRRGVVLDPFMGAGTVAVVAEEHQRDWTGIELNPDYAALAMQRIEQARRTRATDSSHEGTPMAA